MVFSLLSQRLNSRFFIESFDELYHGFLPGLLPGDEKGNQVGSLVVLDSLSPQLADVVIKLLDFLRVIAAEPLIALFNRTLTENSYIEAVSLLRVWDISSARKRRWATAISLFRPSLQGTCTHYCREEMKGCCSCPGRVDRGVNRRSSKNG